MTNKKSFSSVFYDLSSGLVVFLVALPLCLGIALASDAPIVSGLIAGIVGGIVIGAISSSNTSVSGPAAGLTSVVAAAIATLGSFENFLVALIIAGIFQIILGLGKAGFIAAFFPGNVIKGLLFAIGFILILKQIPHLFGLDTDFEGEMSFLQADKENTFSELFEIYANLDFGAMLVGFLCLTLIIIWDNTRLKLLKIPSPLVVVIFGSLLSLVLPLINPNLLIGTKHLVQMPSVDSFSNLGKILIWPNFAALKNMQVYLLGITLALVASLETLLNLQATDKLDYKKRFSCPNRELLAQGVGNIFLGFIGGIPTTSVIIRSSVNINSNAQSKKSTIFHGIYLLLSIVFLAKFLNIIPLSALAAILIVTGFKLAKPSLVKQMWNEGYNQFVPFVLTVFFILFSDLLIGVTLGLFSSIFFILHASLKNPIKIFKEDYLGSKVKRIVLANQVTFLHKASLSEVFDKANSKSHLVLDATNTEYIDSDILDMIDDFKNETAKIRNVMVSLVGFKERYEIKDKIEYVDHATLDLQRKITPKEVLEILKEGNKRVLEGKTITKNILHQINSTSQGQYPLAVILGCIDSRAPAELIFDLGLGNIFNIRVAGNVVGKKILGSLEFACDIAHAKLIVVLGHTKCGAILAALDESQDFSQYAYLPRILGYIKRIIPNALLHKHEKTPLDEYEVIKANVFQSIEKITSQSSVIANLIAKKEVEIVGCIYDVSTGKATFLEPYI